MTFPIYPLLTFRSSPELFHSGAAGQGHTLLGCLPCALPPFGVFPMMGSHIPQGFQALVKVPPQRFSRSRGFDSTHHLPALFHAGPTLGVSLQGRFPPAELYVLSNAHTLLWLVRKPPLQGFRPCERSCPPPVSWRRAATLMGFSSLGVSPFSSMLLEAILSRASWSSENPSCPLLHRVLSTKRLA